MQFKKKLLSAAVLATVGMAGLVGSAQAVSLGQDGTGQVLIYPYYTVNGNNATIITLTNTTNAYKAVKVRFLESENSQEVLDFNLYLSPQDVWTGAIEVEGNNVVVNTVDTSCTSPRNLNAVGGDGLPNKAFRTYQIGDARAALAATRLRQGYIEVIEMGEVSNATWQDAIEHNQAVTPATPTCSGIDTFWAAFPGNLENDASSDGLLSAPAGGLMGTGSIINIEDGADYSYDAVALEDFKSAVDHYKPGSLLPSLAEAAPIAHIFADNTVYELDTAAAIGRPDSVSAVLQRVSVMNDYTVSADYGADTEWVVTFPTKRYYVNGSLPVAPFTSTFGVNGACEPFTRLVKNREEGPVAQGSVIVSPPPPLGANPTLCFEANVVAFGQNGGSTPTTILGAANATGLTGVPSEGWARIGFAATGHVLSADTTDLVNATSDASADFLGLPVLGFGVQRYVNASASVTVANYGGAFAHKYGRTISFTPAQ